MAPCPWQRGDGKAQEVMCLEHAVDAFLSTLARHFLKGTGLTTRLRIYKQEKIDSASPLVTRACRGRAAGSSWVAPRPWCCCWALCTGTQLGAGTAKSFPD